MLLFLIQASCCLSLIPSVDWLTSAGMTRGMRCSIDIKLTGTFFVKPSLPPALGSDGVPPLIDFRASESGQYSAGAGFIEFATRLGCRWLVTLEIA